ncbi:MAG TPA: hypothetical protein VEJ18_17385 [Planctomycetota bacterium]|nr:hypothetical protein [Planctomycetota bacterium]
MSVDPRIVYRLKLIDRAVKAGLKRHEGEVWWPEMAPLSKPERAHVLKEIRTLRKEFNQP